MKALVIDDSRAIRRILVKTLKELDIEVVEAGHGQGSPRQARRWRGSRPNHG